MPDDAPLTALRSVPDGQPGNGVPASGRPTHGRPGTGPRDLRRGILAIVGAALLFSISHAVIKVEGAIYPLFQIIFFRGVFAIIPLLPFFWREGAAVMKTQHPWLQAIRSAAGIASMIAFFYALQFLPLADATAINFTMPLFVTALSVPILRERVGWRRWAAVAVGFSGILLMTRPGASLLDAAILIALASAFGYAVAVLCMRKLGPTDRSATTSFYFTISSALIGAAALPFVWVQPTLTGWITLSLVGIISGTAQLLMTAGYRLAPAALAAPFDYTSMIWAVLLGFLIWGDVPTAGVLAGAALVIGSGLFILHRERVRHAPLPD